MYRVYVIDSGIQYVLLDLRDSRYIIQNPVLSRGLKKTGSFSFVIHPTHPNFSHINMLKSLIKVYSVKNNVEKWMYTGRPITSEEEFYRTGSVVCEGVLAYLIDSTVRPYEYAGSPNNYVRQFITQHNSQMNSAKQFKPGNIDITDADNNNYITRASEEYVSTFDELNGKVVDALDVYPSIREESGQLYFDCVESLPTNTQKIQFAVNLLDFKRKKDSATFCTAIIPIGAEIEPEVPEGETADTSFDTKREKLTIKYYCPTSRPDDWNTKYRDYCTRSGTEETGYTYTFLDSYTAPTWVANRYYYGLDYLYDAALVQEYGYITMPVTWDDVTLQSNLFNKGKKWLRNVYMNDEITVGVADLSMKEDDVQEFYLGWVEFISTPHKINATLLLSEIKIPLLNPLGSEFTIGRKIETFTESTNRNNTEVIESINRKIQTMKSQKVDAVTQAQLEAAVNNASNLITGVTGGYVILDQDESGKPYRLLVMDAPDTATATNVIQINKNGIGFSTSGVNGTYKNAWTIDGQLVAEFITTANLIAGTVGGWNIGESIIRKTITIDGYHYQIAMQAPDGTGTTNCYYVRRKPDSTNISDETDWEYVFRIRYDGYIFVTSGMVGGWTVTGTTIRQQETLNINGDNYIYQVCLQCVSDEKETTNFIYVRRYLASQPTPADASGWEYLARINKHGDGLFQKLRARKSLQAGTVVVACTAGATVAAKITFTEPMNRTPVVVVSPISTVPEKVRCSASNRSTSGFTINAYRESTADTTFAWFAIAD